jgi:CBS domain-containing protein
MMTANPQCCMPQDTVAVAASRMASGGFGAVPVIDPHNGRLVGIITDRDITCRVSAKWLDPNLVQSGPRCRGMWPHWAPTRASTTASA